MCTPTRHITLASLAMLALWIAQVEAVFHGICYSPYTSMGVCRTPLELEEDVGLMIAHTRRIRLYSVECPEVMHALLKKASTGQLSILIGIWIENSPRDMNELDMLIEYLKQYPNASLEGIVVGNEVLFRGQATPGYMAYMVGEAKNRVRGLGYAIGSSVLQTVDIFSVEETPNPAVVAVSDAVGVNIHPFYDHTLPQSDDPVAMGKMAADRFTMKLDAIRSKFPGKKIVVTEVGWPTSSDIYAGDSQKGSDLLQLNFIEAFLAAISANPVPYYFFEFKNADWKRYNGYQSKGSEYAFGLFDSNGAKKIWGYSKSAAGKRTG